MPGIPTYLSELSQYVEDNLQNPTALIAALAALLGDPETYKSVKGRPLIQFENFAHEILIRDRALGEFIQDQETPVSRTLIRGKWCADWRGLRSLSSREPHGEKYDVCISFAAEDREVAGRIASLIKSNGLNRKVFYDDFGKVALWGEELASYLHKIYSQQSRFCIILFSHAYSRKAWTRHELRAALTRVVQEQGSYVLPVALDVAAVPGEFASVGYWPFNPGDEQKIAEAVEEKIDEYLELHAFRIEELTDIFRYELAVEAILDGVRSGIREKTAAGDRTSAQVLTVLALIASSDIEHIDRSARAVIDLVLFAAGPVGDSFENDVAKVVGTASLRRHLGGAFALAAKDWETTDWAEYFKPRIEIWDALVSDSEDQKSDSDDD
jgi:hypothetical protein